MTLVRGCHVIAKGDQIEAQRIIPEIMKRGLLINTNSWGTGSWAYYATMVLKPRSHEPAVVFDVEDKYVTPISVPIPSNPNYAYMELYDPSLRYIPISLLGFVNCFNPLVPIYHGTIGFC